MRDQTPKDTTPETLEEDSAPQQSWLDESADADKESTQDLGAINITVDSKPDNNSQLHSGTIGLGDTVEDPSEDEVAPDRADTPSAQDTPRDFASTDAPGTSADATAPRPEQPSPQAQMQQEAAPDTARAQATDTESAQPETLTQTLNTAATAPATAPETDQPEATFAPAPTGPDQAPVEEQEHSQILSSRFSGQAERSAAQADVSPQDQPAATLTDTPDPQPTSSEPQAQAPDPEQSDPVPTPDTAAPGTPETAEQPSAQPDSTTQPEPPAQPEPRATDAPVEAAEIPNSVSETADHATTTPEPSLSAAPVEPAPAATPSLSEEPPQAPSAQKTTDPIADLPPVGEAVEVPQPPVDVPETAEAAPQVFDTPLAEDLDIPQTPADISETAAMAPQPMETPMAEDFPQPPADMPEAADATPQPLETPLGETVDIPQPAVDISETVDTAPQPAASPVAEGIPQPPADIPDSAEAALQPEEPLQAPFEAPAPGMPADPPPALEDAPQAAPGDLETPLDDTTTMVQTDDPAMPVAEESVPTSQAPADLVDRDEPSPAPAAATPLQAAPEPPLETPPSDAPAAASPETADLVEPPVDVTSEAPVPHTPKDADTPSQSAAPEAETNAQATPLPVDNPAQEVDAQTPDAGVSDPLEVADELPVPPVENTTLTGSAPQPEITPPATPPEADAQVAQPAPQTPDTPQAAPTPPSALPTDEAAAPAAEPAPTTEVPPAPAVALPESFDLAAARPEVPVTPTAPGDTATLNVRLGGEAYKGDPAYEVIVDGQTVATGTVDWARETTTDGRYASLDQVDWRDVAIDIQVPEGGFSSVEVRFPNDKWKKDVGDRNLLVDNITIDGATYEAEAEDTAYHGGKFKDGVTSERMPWRGTLEFDVTDMADVATAQATPEGAYVLENDPGAVVGTLSLSAEVLEAGFEITVSDDRFEVEGNTLKLKDDIALDHEELQSLALEVTLSDGTSEVSQNFDVAVADVAEAAPAPGPIEEPADPAAEVAQDANAAPVAEAAEVTEAAEPAPETTERNAQAPDPALSGSEPANAAPDGLTLETATDNLIVNGSFENFEVRSGGWKAFNEDTSGGWDISASAEVWDSLKGIDSSEGEQHAELDSGHGVDSISQTVATQPGHVYDLSMDLRERLTDGTDTVEVYWNGALVQEINPDSNTWETFDMKVVGTGEDTLEIREAADQNDSYGALLDNIVLTEAPGTIAEGVEGAVIGQIAVSDTDDTTHTFEVSDDRFEVVEGTLKLKEGVTLDHAEAGSLTVEVTATDSAGGAATASFDVTVADADSLQGLPTSDLAAQAEPATGSTSGVFVARYFDADTRLHELSDIDWDATPTHQEGISEINYKNGRGSFWEDGSKDTFGVQIEGQIDVPESGTFSFTLGADDGAILLIDGQPVIDNDGLHAFKSETVELELEPGPHAIEVVYFENFGHAGLKLEWDGPGVDGPALVTPMQGGAMEAIEGIPLGMQVDLPLDAAPSTVMLEGLPAGFTLESGAHSLDSTGGPLDLEGWDLSQLQITPPLGFEGQVKAEITGETTDGARASAEIAFDVTDASHAYAEPLLETGFHVEFFEEDSTLRRLDDVDFDAAPAAEGIYEQIDFQNSRDSFWEDGAKDHFAVRVTGEVAIDEGGVYDFRLASDDGAKLFINGEEVVDNDGRHGFRNRDGEIELEPGVHEIEIRYFENTGRAGLRFEYSGPDTDGSYETVPAHDMPSTDTSGPAQFGVNLDSLSSVSQVTMEGVPAGSWVSDGANAVLVTDGSVDVGEWDLDLLQVTLPDGVSSDVTVELHATGMAFNGAEVSHSVAFDIEVDVPGQIAEAVDMSLWSNPDTGAAAGAEGSDAQPVDLSEAVAQLDESQQSETDDLTFSIDV